MMDFAQLLAMLQMAQQLTMANNQGELPWMLAQGQNAQPRISEQDLNEIMNRPKNYMVPQEEMQRYIIPPPRISEQELNEALTRPKNNMVPLEELRQYFIPPSYIDESALLEMLSRPRNYNPNTPVINQFVRGL